jgi:hypothetical protein
MNNSMSDNKQWSREEGNKSQTYAGATFAGKTTTDTIRNFAEMLIDDIAGNRIDTIEKHWNDARRIDNVIAKQVFGGEYSDRIGQAYSKNLTKYQIPEFRKMWDNRVKQGNYLEKSLKKLDEHYTLCIDIIDLGLSICPNSVNLYLLSVSCCLNYLIVDLKNGNVNGTLKVYKKREYEIVKKVAHLNLHNALLLEPQNRTALIYKQHLKEVSEWKIGFFMWLFGWPRIGNY